MTIIYEIIVDDVEQKSFFHTTHSVSFFSRCLDTKISYYELLSVLVLCKYTKLDMHMSNLTIRGGLYHSQIIRFVQGGRMKLHNKGENPKA
jgi:hypothetical protein